MTKTTIYRQHRTADEINGYYVVVSHDGEVDCTSGKWTATLEAAEAEAQARTSGAYRIVDAAPMW
jgi:hypothetical protein